MDTLNYSPEIKKFGLEKVSIYFSLVVLEHGVGHSLIVLAKTTGGN